MLISEFRRFWKSESSSHMRLVCFSQSRVRLTSRILQLRTIRSPELLDLELAIKTCNPFMDGSGDCHLVPLASFLEPQLTEACMKCCSLLLGCNHFRNSNLWQDSLKSSRLFCVEFHSAACVVSNLPRGRRNLRPCKLDRDLFTLYRHGMN